MRQQGRMGHWAVTQVCEALGQTPVEIPHMCWGRGGETMVVKLKSMKLGPRAAKSLGQGHPAPKWQVWDWMWVWDPKSQVPAMILYGLWGKGSPLPVLSFHTNGEWLPCLFLVRSPWRLGFGTS